MPAFSTTKCRLELSCKYLENGSNTPRANSREGKSSLSIQEINQDREPKPLVGIEEKLTNIKSANLEALLAKASNEKERWEILSRELAQKQELIHRLIRESDDKTESLKITVHFPYIMKSLNL